MVSYQYSALDTKEVIRHLRYVNDIANELNQDFKKGKISSIDLTRELLRLEWELNKKQHPELSEASTFARFKYSW